MKVITVVIKNYKSINEMETGNMIDRKESNKSKHLIVDFMHLVHRALYVRTYLSYEIPKKDVKMISEKECDINILGKWFPYFIDGETISLTENGVNIRTTTIYMVIKFIEGMKKDLEADGSNVCVTICFDSKKNNRKESNHEYKAERVSKLNNNNHSDVEVIEHLLYKAGYNCLKIPGYEADDLIYWANAKYKEQYNETYIMTNDMDLISNVGGSTKLMIRRGKEKKYIEVNESNADELCEKVYKIKMPYSSIILYKSTVGDKSDNIKGIKGFGGKAFERMLERIDCSGLLQWQKVKKVIEEYDFSNEDKESALASLEMVKPQDIDLEEITRPSAGHNAKDVYEELGITKI